MQYVPMEATHSTLNPSGFELTNGEFSIRNPRSTPVVPPETSSVYSSVEEYVQAMGGHRPIRRILIANNGTSAVKAIRSMRHWAYATFGNEKELEFVVLATLDDIEANAEFISEADFFVEVPSGPNNNNYANIHLIVQIAEENACDAVWPGWGHASESFKLPLALLRSSRHIEWIGPNPSSMMALGDKIGSAIVAQSVDVPCVPWSGSNVKLEEGFDASKGLNPEKIKEACVNTADEVLYVCSKIGYPVMIKASGGGGGKGIRRCDNAASVPKLYRQVANEVKGSNIFVMQVVSRCRHLEVQILADYHGNIRSMGSRDCSIQRRCQKIVEESPVLIASQELVEKMEAAAVRICTAVGYTNAGTCEFLYDSVTEEFYFLEVNARLQVEHVVTECLNDINLPAAQLQVAMGIPLHKIPDIQRFLENQKNKSLQAKHVIAARITAEHAEEGFRPTCGAVHELSFRPPRQVWGYFSIGHAGRIHAFSDSQFGHIFASGINREDARANLIMALKGLTVRGEIRTNIELLIRILETESFRTNHTHTTWLENSSELSSPISPSEIPHSVLLAVFLGAVYEAFTYFVDSQAEFKKKVEQGQLPPSILVQFRDELVYKGYKFSLNCLYSGPHQVTVELNGTHVVATIRQITSSINSESTEAGGGYLVSGGIDWRTHRVYYRRDSTGLRVTFDGTTHTFTKEIDPSQIRAPISGKLVRWLVPNDSNVIRGQSFAEIEIMKMYMELHAQQCGKMCHVLAEGAIFQSGDLMATLVLPADVKVCKAIPYEGKFHKIKTLDSFSVQNPYYGLQTVVGKLVDALSGYGSFNEDIDAHIKTFFELIINPKLPICEFTEALAVLDTQLPESLTNELNKILKRARMASSGMSGSPNENPKHAYEGVSCSSFETASVGSVPKQHHLDGLEMEYGYRGKPAVCELPVIELFQAIESQLYEQNNADYEGIQVSKVLLEPLFCVLKRYEKGLIIAASDQIVDLLYRYLEVEELFHSTTDQAAKVIQSKRTEYDSSKLLLLARSHQNLKDKNRIISKVLNYIRCSPVWQTSHFFQAFLRTYADFMENIPNLHDALYRISCLSKPDYSSVSFRARQLLLTRNEKPFGPRTSALVERLLEYSDRRSGGVTPLLSTSSSSGISVFVSDLQGCSDDSLVSLFVHSNYKIRKLAIDIYIRRYYDQHGVHEALFHTEGDVWLQEGTPYAINTLLKNSSDTSAAEDYLVTTQPNPGMVLSLEHTSGRSAPSASTGMSYEMDGEELWGKQFLQQNCPLLAVWTHHALFYQEFLNETTDILHIDSNGVPTENESFDRHSGFEEGNRWDASEAHVHGAHSIPWNDSRTNPNRNGSSTGEADDFEILGTASKLHHMLRAFGGSNEGVEYGTVGKSQQTIAIAFHSMSDLQLKLGDCLEEYGRLSKVMPPSPPSVDCKILLLFIANMDSKEANETPGDSDCSNSIASSFRQELQKHKELLKLHSLFLVCISYLDNVSPGDFSEEINNGAGLSDTDEIPLKDLGLTASHVPRFVYFRCRNHIRFPYTRTQDTPTLLSASPTPHIEDAAKSAQISTNGIVANGQSSTPYRNDLANKVDASVVSLTEESLLQNVNMCHFPLLELKRLRTFKVIIIPTSLPQIHIYKAFPRQLYGNAMGGQTSRSVQQHMGFSNQGMAPRYFIRIILHHPPYAVSEDIFSELERYFVSGLNALEVASHNEFDKKAGNHILVVTVCSFSQQSRISPITTEAAARSLATRYEKRMAQNCVNSMELRYVQRASRMSESCVPIRLILDNPTGQALRVRKFIEVTNPTTGKQVFSALDGGESLLLPSKEGGTNNVPRVSRSNDFDSKSVDIPHPLTSPLDQKRALAASLSTVYIYDFLDLFEEAIKQQWKKCPKFYYRHLEEAYAAVSPEDSPRSNATAATARSYSSAPSATFLPEKVLEVVELALNSKGFLEEVFREAGQNDCSIVVWKLNLCTPEFPKGRSIILIGNDVTVQMGTFGVQEDLLFQRASEMARKQGIPRVYIAVNSGARMGLAAEVQKCFNVEWIDPENPSRGFKYLYLTPADYKRLRASDSVVAEPVDHRSGKVYKITDVIGSQIGLGVENLCGSGAIAGETSKAYNSTLTITFVSGRNVGIGAYITRLGQRVIQKAAGAPILLTGYQALNRLIGRDVYTSNDEIGGIDVMHKNGVSHLVVKGDIEGCEAILDWLSYIPAHRDGPLPIMVDPNDPVNRSVFYKPSRATDDPRLMLTGCIDPKGQWLGGILDRGTFREVMSEWAKSVICGRARLGGIPIGVIQVETRVTEAKQPADPAMPNTSEITFPRAGQVWFPDSAYKTAQAIWDFNREELPLFVFANWRGFSGGQRDMFNEVLKFGSFIVDALASYKQPCFVYIPPKAELRGGAWVVVDPRINSEHMEMYADTDCRGGVLEPTGMVEIKYREKALVETAARLDTILRQLAAEDKVLEQEGVPIDAPRRQALKEKRDKRLQDLLPVYKQVAVYFADLHDTPMRMKKKHAIHDIVPWEKSRHFFYWRLRRQLILFNLRNEVVRCHPTITLMAAERLIYKWAEDSGHSVESNYQFVQWACHSIQDITRRLNLLRHQYIRQLTADLCKESDKAVIEGIEACDPAILKALNVPTMPSSITNNPPRNTERSAVALTVITNPSEDQ